MTYEGETFSNVAVIDKVREPFGVLGNMSRHPIEYAGRTWPTAEALFQSLRFAADDPICELIRTQRNPMHAKWLAKSNSELFVVQPMTAGDVFNMTEVLRQKLEQHADVREVLASTADREIIEDCTKRQRGSGLFWGAALRDGKWYGRNQLGRLWMRLRKDALG